MPPAEVKAKDYAEKELGVHSAYHDALSALTDHDEAVVQRTDVAELIRTKRNAIADRESDVHQETVEANPEMKPTPLKDEVRTAIAADDQLRTLRAELNHLLAEADSAESAVEHAKYRMRIYTARLEELAGLLRFYAAVKLTTIQGSERS